MNIASSRTITITELAHLIRKISKDKFSKDVSITFQQKENHEKFIIHDYEKFNRISISDLRNTGYEIKMSLEDGILEIFNYLKNFSSD